MIFFPIFFSPHQISENKIGIKLCIKKASDATVQQPKKASRKRSRKPRGLTQVDSDDDEPAVAVSPEKRTRRPRDSSRRTNNNTEKAAVAPPEEYKRPEDQSAWADQLPEHVLCEVSCLMVL